MNTAGKEVAFIEPRVIPPRVGSVIFGLLLTLYAFARVLQVYPGRVPMLAVVALHVFPPAIFAVLHGAKVYRPRAILVFVVICLLVGNISENFGVRTGFPFGHYYFTTLMGPKILVVPIMLGIAYVGMAYLSWTIASVILGWRMPLNGLRVVSLPLIAALMMVAWDLCLDPVWSTVLHAWIFPNGGAYFGVPISNFVGWFLTVYIIYQFFALYLRRGGTDQAPLALHYWHQAIGFYAVSAAGNLLLVLPQKRFTLVTDSAGSQWKVSDITAACALVTLLTMGVFALLAWARLTQGARGDRSQQEMRI